VLVFSLLLTASVRGRRLVEFDLDSDLYLHTDYPMYKFINTYLQFHLPLGYNCVSVIRFSYDHQFTLNDRKYIAVKFFYFLFLQVSDIRSRCHQSLLPVTESTVSTTTATATSRISRIVA